jgi:DNA-binding FrmR family transcriptional regulator
LRFRLQEFLRLGLEPPAATRRAEEMVLGLVREAVLGRGGINAHAADRIDREGRGGGFVLIAVFAAAAGASLRLGAMMMMAGVSRAGSVCVILIRLRHENAPWHLDLDTPWGYMTSMRTEIKTSCLRRLKRIEGQIRGLAGMVEDDRYCIDVVTQIAAAKAALRRVEEEILRDHVAHCVEHAISSGDKADQRRKIAELMDVVSRADR